MKLRADFAVRFMVSNIRKEILIVALLLLSITILRVKFNKFEVTSKQLCVKSLYICLY